MQIYFLLFKAILINLYFYLIWEKNRQPYLKIFDSITKAGTIFFFYTIRIIIIRNWFKTDFAILDQIYKHHQSNKLPLKISNF